MNDKYINIEKIELASSNLRFDNDWNPKTNLEEYLRDKNNNYNENQTAKKLFKFEDDLQEFSDLLESIAEGGFDTDVDNVFVIEKKKDDKFIVAEGNRRILALKLINKKINLPEINFFKLQKGDDIGESQRTENSLKNNYKKILESLKKIPLIPKISVKIVEKDKTLSKIIHSRHSAGNIRGKRNWSKGKYLYSLFQMKTDNKEWEEEIKIIAMKYNKTIKQIKDDIKRSEWVIELIISSGEEVGEFVLNNKISSLYKQFVKSSLKLSDYEETDIDKYLGNQINNYNSEKFKSLAKLVIDLFKKSKKGEMFISTRQTQHNSESKRRILEFFGLKPIIKQNQKINELKPRHLFELNENDLEKLNDNDKDTKNAKLIIQKFNNKKEEFLKISLGNLGQESKIKNEILLLINNFQKFSIDHLNNIDILCYIIRTLDEIIKFAIIERDDRICFKENEKKVINFAKKEENKICDIKSRVLFSQDKSYRNFRKDVGYYEKWITNIIGNKEKNTIEFLNKNQKIITRMNFLDKNSKNIVNIIIHEPFNFDRNKNENILKYMKDFEEIISNVLIIMSFIYLKDK